MHTDRKEENEDKQDVVESASATTSKDNSKSGHFAYVITAIAIVASLALSIIGAGCSAVIVTSLAQNSSSQSIDSYSQWLDEDLDFEEWLDRYENWDNTSNPGKRDDNIGTGTIGVDEALDFDLAPYSVSIDSEVSASAYAGIPEELHTFVRDLIARDNEHSMRVSQCLNTAALDEAVRTEKLDEARAICDEARAAIDGLELPALGGDGNGEVRDLLGTAKSNANHRWELIAAEIDLLHSADIDKNRLWEIDDDIVLATEDAGNNLEDAMARSAAR